jgi:adenylosuccinate synthase
VLDGFETIKACTAYRINGQQTRQFPFDVVDGELEPVYEELKGWKTDMTSMKSPEQFPAEFNAYIDFLERELNVPICIVSVGPDRSQTIIRGEI